MSTRRNDWWGAFMMRAWFILRFDAFRVRHARVFAADAVIFTCAMLINENKHWWRARVRPARRARARHAATLSMMLADNERRHYRCHCAMPPRARAVTMPIFYAVLLLLFLRATRRAIRAARAARHATLSCARAAMRMPRRASYYAPLLMIIDDDITAWCASRACLCWWRAAMRARDTRTIRRRFTSIYRLLYRRVDYQTSRHAPCWCLFTPALLASSPDDFPIVMLFRLRSRLPPLPSRRHYFEGGSGSIEDDDDYHDGLPAHRDHQMLSFFINNDTMSPACREPRCQRWDWTIEWNDDNIWNNNDDNDIPYTNEWWWLMTIFIFRAFYLLFNGLTPPASSIIIMRAITVIIIIDWWLMPRWLPMIFRFADDYHAERRLIRQRPQNHQGGIYHTDRCFLPDDEDDDDDYWYPPFDAHHAELSRGMPPGKFIRAVRRSLISITTRYSLDDTPRHYHLGWIILSRRRWFHKKSQYNMYVRYRYVFYYFVLW